MSIRRLAPADVQPVSFALSDENERYLQAQIAKYPQGRQASAVIAALWQAQKQAGWLSKAAIEAVAARLEMPIIRVMEVATFYTMFNLEPVGRFFVQLCGTVPCHTMGAIDLKQTLLEKVGDSGHVTADGNLSWAEVECLGACCNAPMVQINDDYYEDLTPDLLVRLLDDLVAGREVRPGPQAGRRASEPQGAVDTLTDGTLFDGSLLGTWRKRFEEKPVQTPEADAAEAAGPNDPKPAKPTATHPAQSPAGNGPTQRVKNGKDPTRPDETASATKPDNRMAAPVGTERAPQSGKSYTAVPSRPEDGRVAAGSEGTTPVSGPATTGNSEGGVGSAEKPVGVDPTAKPGTLPQGS